MRETRATRWVVFSAFFFAVASVDGQETVVVPDDYDTIQEAIDDVASGDTVQVEPGIYVENLDFDGKSITLVSSEGAEDTLILGADDTLGPDFRSVITLIDDDGTGSVVNGFTIALGSGTSPTATSGITVTVGGGVYVENATLEIVNCVIEENSAGGVFGLDAGLVVENCTVRDNSGMPGVQAWLESDLELRDSTLEDNSTGLSGGGGLHVLRSDALIEDCVIESNSGVLCGGAMFSGDAEVVRTEFRGNSGLAGGALTGGAPVIVATGFVDCTFLDNEGTFGGGFLFSGFASCSFVGCEFSANEASEGGAIFSDGGSFSSATIDRCTLAENSADSAGAIALTISASVTLADSIVWGNGDEPIEVALYASLDATYSNIEGSWDGVGNLDEDPLFVDATAGDFRLQADSPSIDAGDPSETDPDGSIRDQGAYPFEAQPSFLRGDIDANGVVLALVDALELLAWFFLDGDAPACTDAADVDDDGSVAPLLDAVVLLQWGFTNGPAPADPGPTTCGVDPSGDADDLLCEGAMPCP